MSSGTSRAEKQARIAENERLQAINEGTGQVNAIFGPGREREIGDFLQALRDRNQASLGDQKTILDRNTRFRTARRGVTGGSSDIDAKRRNQKSFIQALIGAEDRAQGAVGQLRQSDENTRQRLIDMVFGGSDATTATQRASQALQGNIQQAQGNFIPQALSDIVGAGANAYATGVQGDAFRAGSREAREALYG